MVATVGVGDGPSAVAVGPGAVWAASEVRGTVTRLDPDTNRVVRTIDVGSAPAGAAVVGDGLWVTTRGAPSSHRGGVLKLIAVKSFGIASLDPALWNEGESNHVQGQFLVMTNDGLVGFKRVGGRGRLHARGQPGHRGAAADRRGYHLHLPPAAGDPLLDRPGGDARGRPLVDRTRLQAAVDLAP